ncbi:MAG: TatD DNase family protein [Rhodothermales bacterium]|jgi:TatD DNase family protein
MIQNIFDTHFHLTPDDDLSAMMTRASAAGVTRATVAGAKPAGMAEMAERVDGHPGVYLAAGVHPHDAQDFTDNIELYRELAGRDQVRAIGEIGLDYHYDFSPRERQREVFGVFLDLARELDLPCIIHCRDAYEDCLEMLSSHLGGKVPFVVHCYTGTLEWAQEVLKLGASISFTGIMTFKTAEEIRDVLAAMPHDRVFLETDSPYLSPMPLRGRRNEPAHMPHIVERAADVLGLGAQETADLTTANAMQFYRIAANEPTIG